MLKRLQSKSIIKVAVAGVSLVSIVFASVSDRVGSKAPPLTLKDLGGQRIYLNEMCGPFAPKNERRPVVVHFFGVTCKPCELEIPGFRKITATPNGKKAGWIFVAVYDSIDAVKGYRQKVNLPVKYVLDKHAIAAEDWGIFEKTGSGDELVLPYTFIVDSECIVRGAYRGAHKDIDRLLLEKLKKM